VRSIPVPAAPTALYVRLTAGLDAGVERRGHAPRLSARRVRRSAARWSGWAVAAVLAAALVLEHGGSVAARLAPGTPPMIVSAVADYLRVTTRELPLGCDAGGKPELPFAGAPLRVPEARVLSCWSTSIQGQPASAWAYRWRDQVVVAYVVSEALFFHQPAVREAVRRSGRYTAAAARAGVVAWAAADRGILVIGDGKPAELDALRL
jgi:hypothetical protein